MNVVLNIELCHGWGSKRTPPDRSVVLSLSKSDREIHQARLKNVVAAIRIPGRLKEEETENNI